jgi:hypothetical protein
MVYAILERGFEPTREELESLAKCSDTPMTIRECAEAVLGKGVEISTPSGYRVLRFRARTPAQKAVAFNELLPKTRREQIEMHRKEGWDWDFLSLPSRARIEQAVNRERELMRRRSSS